MSFFFAISSPEVRQEALQIMGVAQFIFALVGSSHQTAPRCVQLGAFLLNVVNSLRVRLDQTLCCLSKRVHLDEGEAEGNISEFLSF